MIIIALSRAKKAYRAKYGLKHTNKTLFKASRVLTKMAGRAPGCEGLFGEVSVSTLESIAKPGFYNAELKRVNSLCYLLDTTTADLLEYTAERLIPDAATEASDEARMPDDKAKAGPDREPDGEPRMTTRLDPVCRAIVDVIQMNDYVVDVKQVGETYRATAKHSGGETLTADGADLFRTICDLAEAAEIELEDG